MTRVDEWTKAEMGVGAAIASGNQEEKGKMADLVQKVIKRIKIVRLGTKSDMKTKRVGAEASI